VVKREQEWREAWILHELRNHHQRETEKGAMREQWKVERQRWVDKLKEYSEASKDLRLKNLQLQSLADDSDAKYSLSQSSVLIYFTSSPNSSSTFYLSICLSASCNH
jgi:hypothetical protein